MIKQGWKICSVFDGNYYSAMSLGFKPYSKKSPGLRKYSFTRWTRPWKGWGPLALFEDKEIAEHYCDDHHTIVPCEYEPSRRWVLRGWEPTSKCFVTRRFLPQGTILAEAIILRAI
jgi:hypothetical protein